MIRSEETNWLIQIYSNFNDNNLLFVYADWIQERGNILRADFIRNSVEVYSRCKSLSCTNCKLTGIDTQYVDYDVITGQHYPIDCTSCETAAMYGQLYAPLKQDPESPYWLCESDSIRSLFLPRKTVRSTLSAELLLRVEGRKNVFEFQFYKGLPFGAKVFARRDESLHHLKTFDRMVMAANMDHLLSNFDAL